jgi:hypothetical protein
MDPPYDSAPRASIPKDIYALQMEQLASLTLTLMPETVVASPALLLLASEE